MGFPLLKVQQEILQMELNSDGNTTLNVQCACLHCKENYEPEIIEKAVNLIIENEQAMRLKFFEENGVVSQIEQPFVWHRLDYHTYLVESEEELAERVRKFAKQPISCWDYPLWKFAIFRSDEDTSVAVAIHHLIADGWAISLITSLIDRYCHLLQQGEEHGATPHFFTDVCLAEQKRLCSERYRNDMEYWQTQYDRIWPLARFHPERPWTEDWTGKRIVWDLPMETVGQLDEFCEVTEYSPTIVFETALVLWLYYKNQTLDRIDLGQMVLGRRSAAEKRMVGNFAYETMNCVPVRKNWTLRELCQQVKGVTFKALRHSLVLYDDILAIAQKCDPKIRVIRDLEFGYIIGGEMMAQLDAEWVTEEEPETSVEYLAYRFREDKLTIFFNYRVAMFTEEEAQIAFTGILTMLENIITMPEQSIDELFRKSGK